MKFVIGPIAIWVTPVAFMKSFVGASQWVARGTPEDLHEFTLFSKDYFSYLLRQPNHQGLAP